MPMPIPGGTASRRWTVDEVRALPDDGNRYEVVDGELLVTPAPTWSHQRVVGALYRILYPYVLANRLGEVIFSPADVRLGRDTMVQPDLFVTTSDARTAAGDWSELGPLRLVIEIVSPSSAHRDRFTKRLLYQRARIPEYWIVDPDARLVERWRPEDERAEVLFERMEWQPEPAVAPLVVDLAALFGEVLGGADEG